MSTYCRNLVKQAQGVPHYEVCEGTTGAVLVVMIFPCSPYMGILHYTACGPYRSLYRHTFYTISLMVPVVLSYTTTSPRPFSKHSGSYWTGRQQQLTNVVTMLCLRSHCAIFNSGSNGIDPRIPNPDISRLQPRITLKPSAGELLPR